MFVKTDQATIERAKRAGQAVLQYQAYQADKTDKAIQAGKDYVNDAIGGFVQPVVNVAPNLYNGISEPFRAGERLTFGTNYTPAMPRMEVAERSAYWNKDGRMLANKGAEIGATVYFGGALGSRMLLMQTGRILTGAEAGYNIGAGLMGKDVTQIDEQGNFRQMGNLERGIRITGGIFGAKQTVNAEIAAPNSLTNQAASKLSDIFDKPLNPPTFKPQTEMVTPDRFKVRVSDNTFEDTTSSIKKGDNTFEMRAKRTSSGVAPDEQVVNALKTEFKPVDYQFGNNTIKLSRAGMKHILQRHHPEFWDGSIKDKQSYFAAKSTIEELQNVITNVLKQNRETLVNRVADRMLQIKGNVNGVEYKLSIERGQIQQLYIPQK